MKPGVVWWWWWWFGVFFTVNNTTPTKVVLCCFGLLVGLWQFIITVETPRPKTIEEYA
jgi:hypothetical protein